MKNTVFKQTTYHRLFLDQVPLILFEYLLHKRFQHFQQIHHHFLVDDYLQNPMHVTHMRLNEHNEQVLELKLLLNNEHRYDKAKDKYFS